MEQDRDFRAQTVAGLNWRFITVVVQFVLQFGVGIVLARLVPVEDFGLVGLALIVVGFGRVLNDMGLAEAIVQRDRLTPRHVRVAFVTTVVVGVLVTAVTIAIAPWVAWFFDDGRVTDLLRFIALTFLFTSFGVVGQALLRRRLAFKRLMGVEVASYGVGYGGVAIVLALQGWGAWSLAWGQLAQSVLGSALGYLATRHPVRPLWAAAEFKQLARFGAGSSLLRIFNYAALQGDYFVVARVLGTEPLGFYTRAYQLMQKPLQYTGQVLSTVLFPAVSRIQKEEERVRRVYAQALQGLTLLVLPAMVLLVLFAPELVVGLYGAKWSGTIVPLQVLAGFGYFRTAYHVSGSFIKARGFVYGLSGLQVIYAAAVVGGSWWGARLAGINGVAWAVGLSILMMYVCVTVMAGRVTGMGGRLFARAHVPGLLLAVPVFAGGYAGKVLLHAAGWPALGVVAGGSLTALAAVLAYVRLAPQGIVRPVVQAVRRMQRQGVVPERAHPWVDRLLPDGPAYEEPQ